MSQRIRGALSAAVACALVAVLAGCGGNQSAGSGLSDDSGATLVRAGALAYVSIDSDLDSSQWQKVDTLLRKFPGRDKWLKQLRQELAKHDLDYDQDIAPALGPHVDIALVRGATPADLSYAWLTKPESTEKARALVRKLNASDQNSDDAVTRVVGDWFIVSASQEMIDRTLRPAGGDSLAEDAIFKAASADLPQDAIAKAYVNGRQLADLFDDYLNGGAQTTAFGTGVAPFGLDKLDWISASLAAHDNGIRFDAGVRGAGGELTNTAEPYVSKLIEGVPADALAFLTFKGGGTTSQLRQLRQNPTFGAALDEFERMTGLSLDDVLTLFDHEVVFYVRRGAGLPEFSLVLEQPQTEKAMATLDRIAAKVAALANTRVREEQRGGLTVKSLTIGSVTVEWAGFDGRVLLTTGPTAIADYRGGGPKLADDADYKEALSAAGAPEKTGGLIYLDLNDGVRLVEDYLGLSGGELPADVRENLKPLQAFVAYSTRSGDETKLAAFLELK